MRIHVPDFNRPQKFGPDGEEFQGMWHHPHTPLWLERSGDTTIIGNATREILSISGEVAEKVFQLMLHQDFRVDYFGPEVDDPKTPRNCHATASWILNRRKDTFVEAVLNRRDAHIFSEERMYEFPCGIQWANVSTPLSAHHSAVALGETDSKDIVLFEKIGINKPFNVGLFSQLNDHHCRRYEQQNGSIKISNGYIPIFYPNHLEATPL